MPDVTRRDFLKFSAGSMAAAAMLAAEGRWSPARAATVNGVSPALRKFLDPLRGLGPSGIPVASPDTTTYPGVDFYRIGVAQYQDLLHPDLPNPTTLWGYYDKSVAPVHKHLGGLIVAKRGTPVRIQVTNELPGKHILPVDLSLMGADEGDNRIATHLHGGFVPWASDGTPYQWMRPDGTTGKSVVSWLPDATGTLTHDLWYPNAQSARLMWYHDHAMGITRLNAYAGIATGYLVTDAVEQALIGPGGALEGLGYGTPLVFQDKVFKQVADTWGGPGDLWYPSVYDANLKGLPYPSCVPESFGDTVLCNGAAYPYVNVEPRRYRFRILNACQAGFLNLSIFYAKSNSATEANTAAAGPSIVQIGTEGGFLPAPVLIKPQKISFDSSGLPVKYSLLMGPAERADIIVDFSNVPVGSRLILFNDAPGPFPGGGGAPTIPVAPGMSPDTMNLVQFRVVKQTVADVSAGRPIVLPAIPPLDLSGATVVGKTLNEEEDSYGRLIQMLGTTERLPSGDFGRAYMDDPTEVVGAGETQVWDIYNLTMDTHPMHFHLVNVQVLGRAPFDARKAVFTPTGPWIAPDLNELGWKETVRMNPGQVTRVAMRFDLPPVPAFVTNQKGKKYAVTLPTSPRTGGHEYVWHCHILEHEEHDMMRPLVVT